MSSLEDLLLSLFCCLFVWFSFLFLFFIVCSCTCICGFFFAFVSLFFRLEKDKVTQLADDWSIVGSEMFPVFHWLKHPSQCTRIIIPIYSSENVEI